MSHHGDEHLAAPGVNPGPPGVMTFGAPGPGDLLADRYRLDEHVDTDSAGRQIWRGMDTVLRRPVALVLRTPGGESAAPMLETAVAASRLVHPHIVSVYDAFDEGDRAYLVREWVPGVSLRDVLRQAPLDAERSTLVTHAIAEAVASLHGAGIVHGNVHPGTILIADDGRVVLVDTHADGPADAEADVRALGAVLYACLTSYWPAEGGHSTLPDAARDSNGRLASPRQIRGGIPRYLDEVATDLLDPNTPAPAASTVAAEFARLATQGAEAEFDEPAGPMGFTASDGSGGRRRAGGKLTLGVAVLATIAVVGAFVGLKVLGNSSGANGTAPGNDSGAPSPSAAAVAGKPLAIKATQVRVVDPPRGDGAELGGAGLAVDGNANTGWSTADYNQPFFGGNKPGDGLKPGMGVLVDLGTPTAVDSVKVMVNQAGASVRLRTGAADPTVGITDPAQARKADGTIATTFTDMASPFDDFTGTTMVFNTDASTPVRYLLVWVTKLPAKGSRFSLTINEIIVYPPA